MRKPFAWRWYPFRTGSGPPGISVFALMDLILGCAYTLLTITSLQRQGGVVASVMSHWVRFMDAGVEATLFFSPAPRMIADPDFVTAVMVYRHALVGSIVLTIACLSASQSYWPMWSRNYWIRLGASGVAAHKLREVILVAYRVELIGIAGMLFLLLFCEPQDKWAVDFIYGNGWAFFRAPLLLALICGLACHAVMLRPLIPTPADE